MAAECLTPCSLPEFAGGEPKACRNRDFLLFFLLYAVILGAKAGYIHTATSVPSCDGTLLH